MAARAEPGFERVRGATGVRSGQRGMSLESSSCSEEMSSLRHTLKEYVAHHHHDEESSSCKDNLLLFPEKRDRSD